MPLAETLMLGYFFSAGCATLAAVVTTLICLDWPREKLDYLKTGLVWTMVVMMWLVLWSTWGREAML